MVTPQLEKPGSFTLDWFKVFGWKANPFVTSILEPLGRFIVGHEGARQKINYFIIQHQAFGTIAAEKGSGATMMALWLRDELLKYKHQATPVYLPLTGLGSVDFIHSIVTSAMPLHEAALVNTYFRLGGHAFQRRLGKRLSWDWLARDSFYSSIAFKQYASLDAIRGYLADKLKNRHLVIILDHVEHMHKQHAQILQSFFYAHLPIQVVVVGTKEALKSSPIKIIQKKDALAIKLAPLSPQELYEMVKKRIASVGGETADPFSEAIVKKLSETCEKNPRRLLAACQEYCVKEALGRIRHPPSPTAVQPVAREPIPAKAGRKKQASSSIGERTKQAPTQLAEERVEPEAPPPKPSFEIPPDILKQIQAEEAEAKQKGKKESGREKKIGSYRFKVTASAPSDEEVQVVETLIDEPVAARGKSKANKAKRTS